MSKTQSDIVVSEEWIASVAVLEEKYCAEVRHVDPREDCKLLIRLGEAGYKLIKPYLSHYSSPKILEMGSGYGFGLCYFLKRKIDIIGVEPANDAPFEGRFKKAIELLAINHIKHPESRLLPSFGEFLPFKENCFDIVFSVSVLEHVGDIKKSMSEALRVVKPDGVVIMRMPNYNSFREGHYNIPWLPYILGSKKYAKWYVRSVFGRADYFIDQLNFTTPAYFRRLLPHLPKCHRLRISLYAGFPFSRISGLNFEFLRKFTFGFRLSCRQRMGFILTNQILRLLCFFGLTPSFRVVCTKKPRRL